MDIASVVGLLMAIGFIFYGMGPSNIGMYIDIPSMIITVGGAISATILSYPLFRFTGVVGVMKNAFFTDKQSAAETIKLMVEFAEQARREGILSLEAKASEIEDEFLKKGVQLAVDGTEPELIKDILSTEIGFIEARHKVGADWFDQLGTLAPAFGMIGTLIGLIAMLANMSDPSSIGPAMAIALITTMYGAMVANIIAIPVSKKLSQFSAAELLIKELMLEGIMSLQSGDNPRIVEQKLAAFIAPAERIGISTKDE